MHKFKIKLHLDEYYKDHRARSLILVSSDYKIIDDLKQHITHVFQINNFNLINQEKFSLPDKESISLIQPEDHIWVSPQEDPLDEPCIKKRKKHKRIQTEADELLEDVDNVKKKLKLIAKKSDSILPVNNLNKTSNCVKNIINSYNSLSRNEDQRDQINNSLTNSKVSIISDVIIHPRNKEEDSTLKKFKLEAANLKNENLIDAVEEKLVPTNKNSINNFVPNGEKNSSREEVSLTHSSSIVIPEQTEDSQLIDEATDEVSDSCNGIRKRKRIRSRKKKIINEKSKHPVILPDRQVKLDVKPLTHIKFHDCESNEEEIIVVDDSEPHGPAATSTPNKETNLKISENGTVLLAKNNLNYDYVNLTHSPISPISDVLLAKCPVMTNIPPCEGDVIVFNMLKLYNKCPEMSSLITAKINKYDGHSEEVTVEILRGLEEFQCDDVDVENPQIPETNQVLKWKSLFRPRLLSP